MATGLSMRYMYPQESPWDTYIPWRPRSHFGSSPLPFWLNAANTSAGRRLTRLSGSSLGFRCSTVPKRDGRARAVLPTPRTAVGATSAERKERAACSESAGCARSVAVQTRTPVAPHAIDVGSRGQTCGSRARKRSSSGCRLCSNRGGRRHSSSGCRRHSSNSGRRHQASRGSRRQPPTWRQGGAPGGPTLLPRVAAAACPPRALRSPFYSSVAADRQRWDSG